MKMQSRMLAISAAVVSAAAGIYLLLNSFSNSLVFFYSPSELAKIENLDRTVRIGGIIEPGSSNEDNKLSFSITDGSQSIAIIHEGVLPPMFRDGQGVVAEGRWDGKIFHSSNLLTKHDESYMPPEVAKALKDSGVWKGQPDGQQTEPEDAQTLPGQEQAE